MQRQLDNITAGKVTEMILEEELSLLGGDYKIKNIKSSKSDSGTLLTIEVVSEDESSGIKITVENFLTSAQMQNLSPEERKQKILDLLEVNWMSQSKLARVFGVSQKTISNDLKNLKVEQ